MSQKLEITGPARYQIVETATMAIVSSDKLVSYKELCSCLRILAKTSGSGLEVTPETIYSNFLLPFRRVYDIQVRTSLEAKLELPQKVEELVADLFGVLMVSEKFAMEAMKAVANRGVSFAVQGDPSNHRNLYLLVEVKYMEGQKTIFYVLSQTKW